MDQASSASELAKKEEVYVIDAILWLKDAWGNVHPSTIQKCCNKCGFIDKVVTDDVENVEVDKELEDFARQQGVTWEEFTNFDCNLAPAMTIEDNWEENFLASVVLKMMMWVLQMR